MGLRSIYSIFVLWLAAGHCLAYEVESLEGIYTQVRDYLRQEYDGKKTSRPPSAGKAEEPRENVKITVGTLDPRLKLHKCDKSLTLALTDNGSRGGNVTVKTRCLGSRPWSIFVTASVETWVPVAIAGRSLTRGTVLQERDIVLEPHNTGTLGHGYVTDPARLQGMQLKQHLRRGDAIRLPALEEPRAVKKGDAIIVEASTGAVLVVTPGTALADGRVGQQIRVRNTRSERVIKAEVIAPGRVRVLL